MDDKNWYYVTQAIILLLLPASKVTETPIDARFDTMNHSKGIANLELVIVTAASQFPASRHRQAGAAGAACWGSPFCSVAL